MQYVVREEPYPGTLGADGLSLSQAEKCNACQLGVNTKITTSNVKLKRQSGAITATQCKRYPEDMTRVQNKTLSVGDFLARLQTGRYSQLVSDSKSTSDQYCQELSISDEDAAKMRESGTMDASKFKKGRIHKVSGASFSEETKAKFIPSIPFQMDFTARKAAMDKGKIAYKGVSESFTVTQMTMYHPAPIRIDSVQADAMLSLNDPSDPAAKYIVLIPLKAVNSGNPSTSFLSKIAPRLFDVKEARPDTGDYQETTIPTGADWALDKLFTLAGDSGSSIVKNGFFTWTGVAGYERYNKGVSFEGNTHVTNIGWRQTAGLSAPQYILLDTPLDINPEDMAVLTQSLPTTPPTEAIHAVPAQTNLIYYKASEPPAPDSMSGKQTCGTGNLCEGFTTGIAHETFAGCPGARCDPFLQNAAQMSGKDSFFTPERMFAFFFGFMTVIAMMLGAYFALILVRDDYDFSLRNFSEQAGQALAVWYKQAAAKIQGLRSLASMGKGGLLSNLTQTATAAATNAASTAVNTAANTATTAASNAANTAATTATNAVNTAATNATTAATNKVASAASAATAPLSNVKSLFGKLKR
jgi:hypothetical protein